MDRPQVIQGRLLGPQELALIQDWLQTHRDSNRTRLSRELCATWNWRNRAGRIKDMAARSLLLKLEAQGQIRLPPRKTASVNALRNGQPLQLEHDQSPVQGPLEKRQPLRVDVVAEGSSDARLFRLLWQRYHYLSADRQVLGPRNCVGQNLKYLARDRHGRPLACLLFGSAAWKVAPGDHWIGWDGEQRRRPLFLLTNNTPFLVLPWGRVSQLASRLLAQVTARLSADWQQKYGHPLHLVETFVEPERFAASCYRAAGWVKLGLTTGRTRNDDGTGPKAPVKSIYVKALHSNGQRKLAS